MTPVAANSSQKAVEGETPFRALLVPGDYDLELENGGLTNPLKRRVSVGPDGFQSAFDMPGFDPARAATEVLGGGR